MDNKFYCYILSNKNSTVLYIGYTEHLKERIRQHKSKNGALFTKKYNCYDLINYEKFSTKKEAKLREKQLKNWHKVWKWNYLKTVNPNFKTLKIT